MAAATPRRLGAILYDRFELLDLYGPLEMFGCLGPEVEIVTVAEQKGPIASTPGAPCVMRSTRTTSRHRPLARVTGLGPDNAASGAPASTAFTRRSSPARRAAASA